MGLRVCHGAVGLLLIAGVLRCTHDTSKQEVAAYEAKLWSEDALSNEALVTNVIGFYQDLNRHLESITDRSSAERGQKYFDLLEAKLQVLGRRIDLLPPWRRSELDQMMKASAELRSEILRLVRSGQRLAQMKEAGDLVTARLAKLRRVKVQ